MESLPKSLLYMTSQISNFTRNIIKVNSLNQTSLSSNGVSQIRLALPVNAVLNMKSLSMHGVVTTKNTGTANDDHVLIPKGGIAALLDRVTWSAGGVSLDNGPVPYHVIYAIKENLEKGQQKSQSDDRVLQQSRIQDKADYAEGQGQKKTLVQNNFLGFTEAHPQYLDMSLLPECFCTIQVASASVCPLQPAGGALGAKSVQPGNPQFSIDNIYFTVEVCQIGSGMYDALTQRLLAERGSIDVPYPQYQVFSQTGPDMGSTSIRGSISCMSLDRMYVVARNNDNTLNSDGVGGWALSQAPVPCGDAIGPCFQQQSVNFGSYDLGTWQFTLNNAPMPMYRADTVDAFNFAVCAEDRAYSKDRGCQVASQKEWLNNKWCATQRLCLDNDPTRLSGTNLSSINAQIVFLGSKRTVDDANPATPAVPTAGGIQLMLVTQQTSVLRIGQSRACAVVA